MLKPSGFFSYFQEVKLHITLLKKRFSTFQYAPYKTHVHIKKLDDHLKFMLPDVSTFSLYFVFYRFLHTYFQR